MPRPLFSETFLASQALSHDRELPNILFQADWNSRSKREPSNDFDHDDSDCDLDDLDFDADEQAGLEQPAAYPSSSSSSSSSSSFSEDRNESNSSSFLIQEKFLDPDSNEALRIKLRGLCQGLCERTRAYLYGCDEEIRREVRRVEETKIEASSKIEVRLWGKMNRLIKELELDWDQVDDEDEDESDEEEDDDEGEEDEEIDYSIEEEEIVEPARALATNESDDHSPTSTTTTSTTPFERRGLGQGWAELARAEAERTLQSRRSFEDNLETIEGVAMQE